MQDLGTVKAFSKSDVLDAVARAKAAQAKWKTSSFDQRRHLLHVISRCITENMVCIKKIQHKKKGTCSTSFPAASRKYGMHNTLTISCVSIHTFYGIHNMYRYISCRYYAYLYILCGAYIICIDIHNTLYISCTSVYVCIHIICVGTHPLDIMYISTFYVGHT